MGVKGLLVRNLEHPSAAQFAKVMNTLGKDAAGISAGVVWVAAANRRETAGWLAGRAGFSARCPAGLSLAQVQAAAGAITSGCRRHSRSRHNVMVAEDPPGRVVRGPQFFAQAIVRPSGLELFFDLVFVFCIAQLARLVRQNPGWGTAGEVVLLSVPVWWAWVGVTFCTDRFPADDLVERVLLLAAAGAAGAMGIALTGMPGHGSAGFALGYATVRVILVVLYARAAWSVPGVAGQARWYAIGFSITAAIWLASLLVPVPGRWVVWAVAMVVDVGIPAAADRRLGLLPVDVRHLPERFGAFVIIVLGESVVSTATLAVQRGVPGSDALTVLAVSFVVAAALWWGFFDRGAWARRYRRLEGGDSGRLANIVCAYLHFPLVAGIACAAVGVQLALEHAGEAIPAAAALALAGGCASYLLTLNVMTIVLDVPRAESLGRFRLVLIAALAALAAGAREWPSATFVGACAAVLLAHVAANLIRSRRSPG